MKRTIPLRIFVTLMLVFAMLSPTAVLAFGDGKKHFKAGMKFETAEQWDQAAESFAMAVAEDPKNSEYRLHLQRSLFNASQQYMKKGTIAANEKDYEGAYIAFRKAYAFDPVNELAKSEMARMVRLQQESLDQKAKPATPAVNDPMRMVQTGYTAAQPGAMMRDDVPQKMDVLKQLPFPSGIPLQQIVKDLARDLDLNVLFDSESRLEGRNVRIDLRNVTAAKALDYIFLQENLFFQKVGPRTILVASGMRRMNFQQLVLRTFYLANASPKDVKQVIMAAIPPQPGRTQTIVLEDAATNSVTVRDTTENVRLIGKLIQSLDKDRAEVVMDVAIYEVNKTDLMQFGNQVGTEAQLLNLGGAGLPLVHSGSTQPITSNLPFAGTLLQVGSIALGLPISQFSALQKKNNTKLIASTQIHAFNNEDSSARIGQRVPVRTATFAPITNTGNNNNNNNFLGDVYNYEQVGLTLKFKPIVFPNQDVQVTMDIESKDVAGGLTQQPVFTERKITGTARIQNNKTLLLASVAQNTESNGRQGLPLLGLIPIIGRLFTAPTKDNRQVDIVIAITPRVIRAPAILPEDEVERDTGSLQTPTSGSLEAMMVQEERDEMLALARRNPTNVQVQLPDQAPTYVRTSSADQVGAQAAGETMAANTGSAPAPAAPAASAVTTPAAALNLKPIESSVRPLTAAETANAPTAAPPVTLVPAAPVKTLGVPDEAAASNAPRSLSRLTLPAAMPELKKGEKTRIAIDVTGEELFRSAVIGLRFDPKKLAVRAINFGSMFGPDAPKGSVEPFINNDGKMFVSLSLPAGTVVTPSGVVAFVEVEALADGRVELGLEKDVVSFLTADGKNVTAKF